MDRTPIGIFLRVSFSFDILKPSLAQQHGHHIVDIVWPFLVKHSDIIKPSLARRYYKAISGAEIL
jgi:hypothetical protein